MTYSLSFYVLIVTIIALIVGEAYILRLKNKTQFHTKFNIFIINLLLWCTALFAETFARNIYGYEGMFFVNIEFVSICSLPIIIFLMGKIFAHTRVDINWRYYLLMIVPVISLLILWTNNYHELFYVEYSVNSDEVLLGHYFYVHTLYSYALIAIGLFYFIYFSVKNSGLFSKQAVLIVIGSTVPITVNVLFSLNLYKLSVYATPIAFSFFLLCSFIATVKFSFLNVVPIALQKVVDHISDGFVVLDAELKVIDFNKTFIDVFKSVAMIKRSDSFIEVLKSNSGNIDFGVNDLLEKIETMKAEEKSLTFEKHLTGNNLDKYFTIELTPVYTNKKFICSILLLKDITEYKKSLQTIKNNQIMLIERERLASLGQLVGGIAHNLKTPIMTLSGGLEAVKDLIKEYDESIDNPNVTKEDHHEIAKDMLSWIEKIKPHCSYMSDIISAVKGQAVQLIDSSSSSFTIGELVNRVHVLMRHEVKKSHCTLNTSINVQSNTVVQGEVNNLVQIIDNIIINAIQSYDGNDGGIDFIIDERNGNLEITIRDYGKGISNEVKNRLFKEMVTTKGKNGTGLGLYMCYSTIKGRFGGNMWFESEENKGTSFYISIPISISTNLDYMQG